MNKDSRNMAARSAMLLAESLEEIRTELRQDPAYDECEADPMIVGLFIVLCNTVMEDANWAKRGRLFKEFAGCKWPSSVTVRERIEEVMDGINLRADHWNFN